MTTLAGSITATPIDVSPALALPMQASRFICAIDCTYCFLLAEQLPRNGKSSTSESELDRYVRQLLEPHRTAKVVIAWQGVEPILMKVELFERALASIEKSRLPGQEMQHTFQTNGMPLDEEWCAFFKEHGFRVGLRIDGPRELHDALPADRLERAPFDQLVQDWRFLRWHGIEFNILSAVTSANEKFGREVYRFLRDKLNARWIQLIPTVERGTAQTMALAKLDWRQQATRQRMLPTQPGEEVTDPSMGGVQYGRFLVDVFEEWVRRDVGRVYVHLFEMTLETYCGGSMDRSASSYEAANEQGLGTGLELFLAHTRPAMQAIAGLLQQGQAPSAVMKLIAAADAKRAIYLPCPCGNGKKFRFCHGNRRPRWTFSHLLQPGE